MKKWTFCIFATLCLSAAFAFAANPRKNIRQANKLAGDYTKVKQARELINEVLADSTFTPDAYTYFVAGKIERHGLRLADVLHRLRYGDARLFADAEKTVHRRAGGENYGRMVEDFDSLAPELFQRDARHTDERLVFDLDLVLLGDFVERRFFDYRRPGLRNQYAVNFQL